MSVLGDVLMGSELDQCVIVISGNWEIMWSVYIGRFFYIGKMWSDVIGGKSVVNGDDR